MNEIIPNLWLGAQKATQDKQVLETIGITHILSLGEQPLSVPDNGSTKFFAVRDTRDGGSSNLGEYRTLLPKAIKYIK